MTRYWSKIFRQTITMLLAGGRGERLYPLTAPRSKPSVPFGGIYRIIDFTLSNCINGGFRRIYVLTQYKSQSLDEHLRKGWSIFNQELHEFVYSVPPQQRYRDRWYSGTADAIFQNINILEKHNPKYVIILSGDHIYKMDYAKMLEFHLEKEADLTISSIPVDSESAKAFGVCAVDDNYRITEFQEKSPEPREIPGRPGTCLANMGVYIFNTHALVREISRDAKRNSAHDFGKNIIPEMLENYNVYAFPYEDENKKTSGYWKDIGTLDSYYNTSMDLVSIDPEFNLYDPDWPIRTYMGQSPPAKTVWGTHERRGQIIESLIANGSIVSGGTVQRSILSPQVRVNSFCHVEESIIFSNVDIGRHSRIRRAIIDKNVRIPEGTMIGYNPEEDRKHFTVSDSGIVVIPKGYRFG